MMQSIVVMCSPNLLSSLPAPTATTTTTPTFFFFGNAANVPSFVQHYPTTHKDKTTVIAFTLATILSRQTSKPRFDVLFVASPSLLVSRLSSLFLSPILFHVCLPSPPPFFPPWFAHDLKLKRTRLMQVFSSWAWTLTNCYAVSWKLIFKLFLVP
eukprot:m.65249 g.65249  ORF g.65249 m.65249 type:complete len:155 (+) comp19620_c0_seq4:134-598(+)